MSTITLQFEPTNTIAQSVVRMLRSIGVFKITEQEDSIDTLVDNETAEREAFLYTSKVNASRYFSKYLD